MAGRAKHQFLRGIEGQEFLQRPLGGPGVDPTDTGIGIDLGFFNALFVSIQGHFFRAVVILHGLQYFFHILVETVICEGLAKNGQIGSWGRLRPFIVAVSNIFSQNFKGFPEALSNMPTILSASMARIVLAQV